MRLAVDGEGSNISGRDHVDKRSRTCFKISLHLLFNRPKIMRVMSDKISVSVLAAHLFHS
jgi:hypothetical protein